MVLTNFNQFFANIIVAPRFGDHGTKEMLGVVGSKVWPVQFKLRSNSQQHTKGCNRECKWTQHVAFNNLASICKGLQHFCLVFASLLRRTLVSFCYKKYYFRCSVRQRILITSKRSRKEALDLKSWSSKGSVKVKVWLKFALKSATKPHTFRGYSLFFSG